MDVDIQVWCNNCNSLLDYSTSGTMIYVNTCEKCMGIVRKGAHKEGYDEGYDEATLDAQRGPK